MPGPKPHRKIFLTAGGKFNFLSKDNGDRRYWPIGKSVLPAKLNTFPLTKKPRGGRA